MRFRDISVPEVYTESQDFRFFLKWFEDALTKIGYDTENGYDLYDPLRCPSKLLWMLADTIGFKYDDRLPASYNRFVLVYFMSMIRNRGSKDGVTLAAEANLKQFDIESVAGTGYTNNHGDFVEPKDILYDRLEDTSIPVNSAQVTPYTADGYIEVVYFSDRIPVDACIEYVRPLGMYCFQHAGVRLDGRTKLIIDARLTDIDDVGLSIGPTHVGHYSRDDYARLQRLTNTKQDLTQTRVSQTHDKELRRGAVRDPMHLEWADKATRTARVPVQELTDTRRNVWYRNADYEGGLNDIPVQAQNRDINPGYRALYSLQLCNNEHVVKSLIPVKPGEPDLKHKEQIFGLGYEPQDVSVSYPDDYVLPDEANEYFIVDGVKRMADWNLRYDKERENAASADVWTIEDNRSTDIVNPRPAVNPIMHVLGDAMVLDDDPIPPEPPAPVDPDFPEDVLRDDDEISTTVSLASFTRLSNVKFNFTLHSDSIIQGSDAPITMPMHGLVAGARYEVSYTLRYSEGTQFKNPDQPIYSTYLRINYMSYGDTHKDTQPHDSTFTFTAESSNNLYFVFENIVERTSFTASFTNVTFRKLP